MRVGNKLVDDNIPFYPSAGSAPTVVVEDVRADVNHRRGDRHRGSESRRSPTGMRYGRVSIDFGFKAPGLSMMSSSPP